VNVLELPPKEVVWRDWQERIEDVSPEIQHSYRLQVAAVSEIAAAEKIAVEKMATRRAKKAAAVADNKAIIRLGRCRSLTLRHTSKTFNFLGECRIT